ncbi:cupin domain-containing protein [Desulfitobacterium hafniense]|uniref:Cyclic nucleotide-binding domain-containing protein n=5 Tax=root TaxID=1 RepID=Q24TX0_DESHY|nr:cupin domain-containing protein [Desulfitobacterium hafniense]ACL21915.1 cyclic nucleotide-binding protein [Desulfitobacterium hafniense DCB-2]KTE90076.1 cupin [Desulfitobacterium hafniense]MEA5022536.1 cupin domain-containing protein [Desulfitobacterium hafniense]CDX02836.1 Cupin domain protein [Desulfitobacterium hafniense]BAE84522.1 hypothetical protein DSY2733 [Desulfitobacterium hafniense Y51]
MARLKNLPQERPLPLASLIEARENQVLSMALAQSDRVQISLFSFADGESVSEEEYFGDTLYLILQGEAVITFDDQKIDLVPEDVLMVPAHKIHAIAGKGRFKMLQITLIDEER